MNKDIIVIIMIIIIIIVIITSYNCVLNNKS